MKGYDLSNLKMALFYIGLAFMIAAVAMAIIVPIKQNRHLTDTIHTYQGQAERAATPAQFAEALRQLNMALTEAGMDQGLTVPKWASKGLADDMAFKKAQFALFADKAEQFAKLPLTSADVNTGMIDSRATLAVMPNSAYGFWMWRQGGALFQLYLPLILLSLGIGTLILEYMLPYTYRRRVTAKPAPA